MWRMKLYNAGNVYSLRRRSFKFNSLSSLSENESLSYLRKKKVGLCLRTRDKVIQLETDYRVDMLVKAITEVCSWRSDAYIAHRGKCNEAETDSGTVIVDFVMY